MSDSSVLFNTDLHSNLPAELVDSLNHAYFLHLLATDPEKVVPPGKSILSMLLHAQLSAVKDKPDATQPLVERVKEAAFKAFWDEAKQSISNPSPAIQLPRLKRLYDDMYDALNPLFPNGHRILETLHSPLAPTTSPLHSTLSFLKEVLEALRARCAPVRDSEIDKLHEALDEWNDAAPHGQQPNSSPLGDLLVDVIQKIILLSEAMKSDLKTAILTSVSEDEVKSMVFSKAKEQEREIVLRLWSRDDEGATQVVRTKWRSWVAELPETSLPTYGSPPEGSLWIPRLMMALESNLAVSCTIPSCTQPPSDRPRQEELPPQFLFTCRRLFLIQNYLQAIAIASALRLLAGLSPSAPSDPSRPEAPNFMYRVWTLLREEIDGKETPDQGTKLVNLADEVIHARRLAKAPNVIDAADETRLREAVDRTLRPQDPVFSLLRHRLVTALAKELVTQFNGGTLRNSRHQLPGLMRAGIGRPQERAGKRPRMQGPNETEKSSPINPHGLYEASTPTFVIKGFEDPVLVNAIYETFFKTFNCVQWVGSVWGDLV